MSKKPSGVENVKRRTWDLAEYERRAQLDLTGQLDEEKRKAAIEEAGELFELAPETAEGPAGSTRAYLVGRDVNIDFERDIGLQKTVMATAEGSEKGGYWCPVCECLLKDNVAFLNHINGKRHQAKRGISMRTKRSGISKVKERLQLLGKQKREKKQAGKLDFEKRQREADRRKQKKRKEGGDTVDLERGDDESTAQRPKKKKRRIDPPAETPEEDSELMKAMGFTGFG